MEYPPFILVTDQIPSSKSMGVTKTLYHILDGYPADKLWILGFDQYQPQGKVLQGKIWYEKLSFIKPLHIGRFSSVPNRIIKNLNGYFRRWKPIKEPPESDAPKFVLVATTHAPKLLMAWYLSQKYKLPIVPYFLDFWMEKQDALALIGGISINVVIKKILANAKGWIMISEPLKKKMEQFFNLKAPPCLIVHNPSSTILPIKMKPSYSTLHFAYAGSLWDMHFDALEALVDTFPMLKKAGFDASLTVYTSPEQKSYRKWWFENNDLIYGGYLEANDLHDALYTADALIVTASFKGITRTSSECSLQTKTTEYLGLGLPIVSIGPTYGVCNHFFSGYQCGFVIETIDIKALAEQLIAVFTTLDEIKARTENARQLALGYYSQKEVHARFRKFLSEMLTD
jgi:glycosyltransferase involved in cell wall biosynthesis